MERVRRLSRRPRHGLATKQHKCNAWAPASPPSEIRAGACRAWTLSGPARHYTASAAMQQLVLFHRRKMAALVALEACFIRNRLRFRC
ncbi:hypothetical protein F441_20476 [Phytophthora nicotianae CJ01A1]|nr:hypothetical protein F443_20604 [Phytophthora nicotianae P1569]ETP02465.1 hypothetical protein F441_20476 [Phytophthora nicotianae CJ01A1]ETP30633.1 hypothetical protein F442_20414 [Phytophthora nicotianae P10297]